MHASHAIRHNAPHARAYTLLHLRVVCIARTHSQINLLFTPFVVLHGFRAVVVRAVLSLRLKINVIASARDLMLCNRSGDCVVVVGGAPAPVHAGSRARPRLNFAMETRGEHAVRTVGVVSTAAAAAAAAEAVDL